MPKIETQDCVTALLQAGHHITWKRAAKYRVEDPSGNDRPCWVREFHNKTDNRIAFVWAYEDAILQFRVLTPATGAGKVVTSQNGYKELTVVPATVPMFKGPDGWEEQDFENCEITDVSDTAIVAIHGGDWQEPVDVEYRLMSDGNLYYNPKACVRG